MSSSARATAKRRARRKEQRKKYFVGQEGVMGYWRCCGQQYLARTLQHARKLLEQHEHEHHKKKPTGSFGVARRGELSTLEPEPKPGHILPRLIRKGDEKVWQILPRLAKNGMIRLDLKQADEVCLLPKKWAGKYPQQSNPCRLRKLSEQQNHRCCYCGKHTWSLHYGEDGDWQDMSTIEHIRCRVHGGTNKKGNLVMACSECNNLRGRKNPIIFLYESQGLLDWKLVPKDQHVPLPAPPA